jgi:pyruvate/2-oxoglutarate dehydrogenase complex dihydrolipoamide acyltransferase (E2) component
MTRATSDTFEQLGANSGLVEEMYRQFLENPAAVAESWRDFFADYQPRFAQQPANGAAETGNGATAAATPTAPTSPSTPAPGPAPASAPTPAPTSAPAPAAKPSPTAGPGAPVLDGEQAVPLRGAAARIVENMEASIGVPTATSLRVIPAKLLEVNRRILNNHLVRSGGGTKVSFTHLIAYAVVRALEQVPNMNSAVGVVVG